MSDYIDRKEFEKMINILWKSGLYQKDDLHEIISGITRLAHSAPLELGWNATDVISQLDSFHANLSQEVRDYVLSTSGVFSSTNVKSSLHLSTRNEGKVLSKVLSDMVKSEEILRVGDQHGQFRKVDAAAFQPLKDFKSEDIIPVDLKFPLGLEHYVNIFQSNIMVVAGQKDLGKTGFCLSFATMNRGHALPIRYISSEFGAAELKSRLLPMDLDPDLWIKDIEFGQYQRNDYQDVIDPDGINIIDYLESVNGEFFKAAEQIRQVYQKLRKGVVLIALQKKKGQEYARGGELTAEKARLYVTLSSSPYKEGEHTKNIATILHCKNRANPLENAKGYWCEYKLAGGHYFKREDLWLPS